METPDHQEWRSRQQIRWPAVGYTALCAGIILFIMSGGSPWSTGGIANAVMGRVILWSMPMLLITHLAVAFVYSTAIAVATYRLRTVPAFGAGLAMMAGLYALNYAFFHAMPIDLQSPESRAIMVHITFGLIAVAAYKAMSVPEPFRGDRQAVERQTRVTTATGNSDDPEPRATSPQDARRPEGAGNARSNPASAR